MTTLPPIEFRMCRMLRTHAMEDHTPAPGEYRGPGWGRTFHLRCVRCGTIRAVTIDSLGNVAASRYIYPDGYKMLADERPETADLRVEYANRRRAKNLGNKPKKRGRR